MERIWEVVPSYEHIDSTLELVKTYQVAFEYNDFMMPRMLDDAVKCKRVIEFYKSLDRDRSMDTLHGAFLDICVHSSDSLIRDASRKRVYQSMEIAQELGVRGVVFHSNTIPNFCAPYYQKQWIGDNTEFWRQAAKDFPKLDIYMENMFDMDSGCITQLGKNLEDVKNFGLCLDYAHASVFGVRESRSHWFEVMTPYVKHMHINDNDLLDDQHLAVGSGKIDWEEFKKLLKASQSPASILVEIKSVTAQRRSFEYLKKAGILDI